jgi:hypothetical protein
MLQVNYSTSLVTFKDGEFVAEASSLGIAPGRRPSGITLKSDKTGRCATFAYMTTVVKFGEVVAWRYVPTRLAWTDNRKLRGTSLVILND